MPEPGCETIRKRVLNAVRKLGEPTTLEVAEQALTPTAEARKHLLELQRAGELQRYGRRWRMTPAEAVKYTPSREPLVHVEKPPLSGCWLFMAMIVLFIGMGALVAFSVVIP